MPVSRKGKAVSLITTDYLALPPETTAETAIIRLGEQAPNLKVIHYIYVLDKEGILEGFASMRDLFAASSHQTLAEICDQKLIGMKRNLTRYPKPF